MLESFFQLSSNNTNFKTEARAGVVTFSTMAYIIFVQPGILAPVMGRTPDEIKMYFGAVMVATCLASALGTLIMGLFANYPIALAPCMGENYFFAAVVSGAVTGTVVGWDVALTAVFLSGVIFVFLSLFKIREKIFDSIPDSLKAGISVGIGLFIAFIGLKESGFIVAAPGSLVKIGNLHSPPTLLTIFGLIFTSILLARGIKGAILLGILATTIAGIPFNLVTFHGFFALPPSISPVLFKLNFKEVFTLAMVPVIIIFFFMVMFDTIGTLIGVGEQAGLMEKGKLPRAGKALLADSIGTTAGALLGTSTVSSFIESAAGVSEGGRTGLANIFTAFLFLLALFFYPVVQMIGGGYEIEPGIYLHPVTAPVLILVGVFMARNVNKIPWHDLSEAIPAFLVIIGMPLTFSIADGFAFGFITYPLLKIASGRGKEVNLLIYILFVIFILYFAFIR